MTDTIIRWECPECDAWGVRGSGPHYRALNAQQVRLCPGIPVERTYVATDTLLSAEVRVAVFAELTRIETMPDLSPEREGEESPEQYVIRRMIVAAINAVTGAKPAQCETCDGSGLAQTELDDCRSCHGTGEKP